MILGFIYRSFGQAGSCVLSKLYKALVLPILDYCDCVWDPHLAYNVQRLDRVQGFAARLVSGKWKRFAPGARLVDVDFKENIS